jgi:hypothetical protein
MEIRDLRVSVNPVMAGVADVEQVAGAVAAPLRTTLDVVKVDSLVLADLHHLRLADSPTATMRYLALFEPFGRPFFELFRPVLVASTRLLDRPRSS